MSWTSLTSFLRVSSLATEIRVTIYRGPQSWFQHEVDGFDSENLFDLAVAESAREPMRQGTSDGAVADDRSDIRLDHVVLGSSDYASFAEHVMQNFSGLLRRFNPEHAHIHNPPKHVQDQLERSFSTVVKNYKYPRVNAKTLVALDDEFENRIVGQGKVKELLLAALYSLAAPARDRPIVLMFYGPSGVGKTETASLVNELLGGELFRKQFSMFHSEKFASYLFGGTVSEASLAHDLLDRESGVVLIDEFDKANPVFHSAFYQLFESGTFEDKNFSVDVGPALIICTSNYDSLSAVTGALGDALASRFDAVIGFAHLEAEHVRELIRRLTASRLARFSPAEKEVLEDVDLEEMFAPLAKQPGNVRRLARLIDQGLSIMLVRALLAQERSKSPSQEA